MGTLLDDLDAFLQEHRRCGALDSDVEDGRVWMTCECGARLCHWLASPLDAREEPPDAERSDRLGPAWKEGVD